MDFAPHDQMHRLPKIFAHRSDHRKNDEDSVSGGSSSSSRRSGKSKPRLERRNARKNISYDHSPSSSSSSSYYASEDSVRARSLDLFGGRQSFRVEGVNGEIEIICKSLGFSGIDAFSISTEEYEMMKVRSSSAPGGLSEAIEKVIHEDVEASGGDGSGDVEVVGSLNREIGSSENFVRFSDRSGEVISRNSEGIHDYRNMVRGRDNVSGSTMVDSARVSDEILSDNGIDRSNEFRRSGIRGVRPPVLGLLAPPPSISLPVIDTECSTWDLFRDFGPNSENQRALDEESGRNRNEDEDHEDERRRIMSREDNCVVSGSCSFTTNSNDDDSSSTATDPISSISPNGIYRRVITTWQKGDLLGRGSFGSVYEGITGDGFFFAIKEVSLLDQGSEGRQSIIQLEQEIALLRKFEHENIVQYYGTEKDESHLYIFIELVTKGSLLSLYQKYTLQEQAVSSYTRQILHGLKYLHNQGVVHRDIKCANILVDTNGLVKLADFGLAKATKLNDVKSCKGTVFWMAPEVVKSQGGYGVPADIWSLGCTVLEMLTGRFPYSNFECMQALYRIGKGERPQIPDSLSKDAKDFIRKCLQVDPSSRSTAAQLLDHPFVKPPLQYALGFASPRHFNRHI